MIKVLIVDDDVDAANALKRNLEGKDNITIIDTAFDGRQAVELFGRLEPDVILMDVRMPIMDGIEATKRIKQLRKSAKILILTMFKEEDKILKAIENQCDGFLFKGLESDELVSVIENVYKGFNTYDRTVQKVIQNQISQKMREDSKRAEELWELNKLTDKEIAIVRLVTAGKKDSEIAKELYLSEGYVRNQLVIIREKLGLRNSKELAVWGAKMNL